MKITKRDASLHAIQRLYDVFARYPLRRDMDNCACGCVTREDEARIAAKPLRKLTSADLAKYAAKATTTWGDVDDLKHFLPRLLELVATEGSVDWQPVESIFRKVDDCEWQTWPEDERAAVQEYFRWLWVTLLHTPPDSLPWDFDAGDCLCAIAQAEDDLASYLEVWRRARGITPMRHFSLFVGKNCHDLALSSHLSGPYWEEREFQELQVINWLRAPQTRGHLEQVSASARSQRLRVASQAAVDQLSRLPARLPRRPQSGFQIIEALLVIHQQPYPLLFATISGAHLYGFPSSDSDYDIRGSHIIPPEELLGLRPPRETVEASVEKNGIKVDLVTHDVGKFFSLLLKRSGYALEQLYSPLTLSVSREHDALKEIAKASITRRHAEHYRGFAATQWKMIEMKGANVKRLLYTFRVLMAGIHLMRTGEVEANLPRLNEEFRLPYLDDLIGQKTSGYEDIELAANGVEFYASEYARLGSLLEDAAANTFLPESSSVEGALHELLLRLRLRPTDKKPKRTTRESRRTARMIADIEHRVEREGEHLQELISNGESSEPIH